MRYRENFTNKFAMFLTNLLYFTDKSQTKEHKLANEKTIPMISIDPTTVTNPAGKITLEEFKEKYGREIKTLEKQVPELTLVHELDLTARALLVCSWGLSAKSCGTRSVIVSVQTPVVAARRAGSSNSTRKYSYKIYRKDIDWQSLSAMQKIQLYAEKAAQDQSIKTGEVPSDFSLFRTVTNSSAGMDVFVDSNVIHEHVYIYRLYTSSNRYIEQIVHYLTVRPSITSFTGVPDPLVRRVKFDYEVENTTQIAVYKGSSQTPLANPSVDTAVQNGNTYSYRLVAKNEWDRTMEKTISVRCTGMKPAKPVLSVVKDAAYVRNRLSWPVLPNVSSCSIVRTRVVNGNRTTRTITPTYANGYYIDSDVVKGATYSYTMTVKNGWGSTAGRAVSITMTGNAPAVPAISSLTTERNGSVNVNIAQVVNATGYKIYRSVNGQERYAGGTSTISYNDFACPVNEEITYRVTAVNGWGESAKSASKAIFSYPCADNQIKRKALCIATKFNERSLKSCSEMAKAFQYNGIPAEYVQNLSEADLKNKLKTFFDGFDADDYPIIMCNAHGSVDYISLLVENGSQKSISFANLKKILDKVPGHKILMIDSCYSGSAVTDNSTVSKKTVKSLALSKEPEFSALDFAATIRGVFSIKTAVAKTAAKTKARTLSTGSGELATPDYSVICSASPNQSSWGYRQEYNYIPYWWSFGLGWDFLQTPEVFKPCGHHSDTNGNRSITVAELAEYSRMREATSDRIISHQSQPFCWPENDGTVVAVFPSSIRYFTLKNSAGAAASMSVSITDPDTGRTSTWSVSGSCAVNGCRQIDLSSRITKNGAKVKLVTVVSGTRRVSNEFIFSALSNQSVSFEVTSSSLTEK